MRAAAIATIGNSGADLCFVALGAPKQELFADHWEEPSGPTYRLFCIGRRTRFHRWGAGARNPIGCRLGSGMAVAALPAIRSGSSTATYCAWGALPGILALAALVPRRH